MNIPFVKMQGTGNDFIIIEREHITGIPINDFSLALNDRHFGIGGDGLIIIDKENGFYKMTMINPDGSEAMCGNGIRCFGLYLVERGYVKEKEFVVDSIAGKKNLIHQIRGDKHYFTVNMGEPILERNKIPLAVEGESPVVDVPVKTSRGEFLATCVSMGNPHAVIFVNTYEGFDLHQIGNEIEHHSLFPQRTNVEFIQVRDRNNLVMRVWERGAGETLACGTGTCAAVVASRLKGYVDDHVTVKLPGGIVEISYSGKEVFMTGEAKTVFSGNVDIVSLQSSLNNT